MRKFNVVLPLIGAIALSACAPATPTPEWPIVSTETPNDADALRGAPHGKGVFLINVSELAKMNRFLGLIADSSHAGMLEQGIEPDFVIVFIGPGVRFLSANPSAEVIAEYGDSLFKTAALVNKLSEAGVQMEFCSVAASMVGLNHEDVLPEIKVVRDGFVSLIGYQAKGYGLVPVL